ncbi:hypothetical protein [Allorhizobium terrae]|uniref:Uncharacterized protein n=1 Tax=Allorhizobium terrae TaxID=1848972 RepID=A0A4V3W888_9HYPH|nr:hypothetical protein [Allorhizobium terrae]THF50232.1 hypothetical protein E6C51_10835 [Allorhizobium terrae]
MQLQYIYETRFPWEPDANLFAGSETSALGMTTELVAVRNGVIADEDETEARFELLIVRRGDGYAYSWEVLDGDTDETVAQGEASTLADAKRAAEASAWHAAERAAGRRIQRAEDWLDEAAASAAAFVAAELARMTPRRGNESG